MTAKILKFPEKIDPEDRDINNAILEIERFALEKATELLGVYNPDALERDFDNDLEGVAMGAHLLLIEAAQKVVDKERGLTAFVKKET